MIVPSEGGGREMNLCNHLQKESPSLPIKSNPDLSPPQVNIWEAIFIVLVKLSSALKRALTRIQRDNISASVGCWGRFGATEGRANSCLASAALENQAAHKGEGMGRGEEQGETERGSCARPEKAPPQPERIAWKSQEGGRRKGPLGFSPTGTSPAQLGGRQWHFAYQLQLHWALGCRKNNILLKCCKCDHSTRTVFYFPPHSFISSKILSSAESKTQFLFLL